MERLGGEQDQEARATHKDGSERAGGDAPPRSPGDEQGGTERARIATPRIYVASLADYNNGRLHGSWIDADQDPDDLRTEIAAMLAESVVHPAEDWAIHDYEGFGAFNMSEFESLDVVSAVALGIAECGLAFAAYAQCLGTSDEMLRAFDERYLGRWHNLEAYARDVASDLGWDAMLGNLPDGMRPYVDIDYARLARDLAGELNVVEGLNAIYVFTSG